ncbi:unnamed protein product [Amoebophrya sp. A25]|nr:unnamed protein product [Amoebophrya sp. A25]|eukprot:GSA25T00012331001.1
MSSSTDLCSSAAPRLSSRSRSTPKQDVLMFRSSSLSQAGSRGGPQETPGYQGEYYDTYLCLDKILDAQFPVSGSALPPAFSAKFSRGTTTASASSSGPLPGAVVGGPSSAPSAVSSAAGAAADASGAPSTAAPSTTLPSASFPGDNHNKPWMKMNDIYDMVKEGTEAVRLAGVGGAVNGTGAAGHGQEPSYLGVGSSTTGPTGGSAASSSSTNTGVGGPLTPLEPRSLEGRLISGTSKAEDASSSRQSPASPVSKVGSGGKANELPLPQDDEQPSREPAHDETLFIIIHQTYELWFKQILHELDAVYTIFSKSKGIPENEISRACHYLYRITKIQEVLVQQIAILETMTSMEFLEFRDYLVPASGFQSWQFRLIEIALGIPMEGRRYGTESFLKGVFEGRHRTALKLFTEQRVSMNKLVERWLERMPFYRTEEYDFWAEYKDAVDTMCTKEEEMIQKFLPPEKQEEELKGLRSVRSAFHSLLDPEAHAEMVKRKVRRWSQRATLAALFIFLYRHEPMLTSPFRLLNLLMEIDQNFSVWRAKHASMAHRMIGMKIGTGGTSGVEYLNKAATENKAFKDLWQLSTFLLPSGALPELPPSLRYRIGFLHDYLEARSPAGSPTPLKHFPDIDLADIEQEPRDQHDTKSDVLKRAVGENSNHDVNSSSPSKEEVISSDLRDKLREERGGGGCPFGYA